MKTKTESRRRRGEDEKNEEESDGAKSRVDEAANASQTERVELLRKGGDNGNVARSQGPTDETKRSALAMRGR